MVFVSEVSVQVSHSASIVFITYRGILVYKSLVKTTKGLYNLLFISDLLTWCDWFMRITFVDKVVFANYRCYKKKLLVVAPCCSCTDIICCMCTEACQITMQSLYLWSQSLYLWSQSLCLRSWYLPQALIGKRAFSPRIFCCPKWRSDKTRQSERVTRHIVLQP